MHKKIVLFSNFHPCKYFMQKIYNMNVLIAPNFVGDHGGILQIYSTLSKIFFFCFFGCRGGAVEELEETRKVNIDVRYVRDRTVASNI